MSAAGFNPMRYDCANGCYNKKLRPKIEVFADCFPGKIAMSDVDGFVEVNSHFLLIEWKSAGGRLGTGQRIALERLTRLHRNITAVVVHGNAETMEITGVQYISRGETGPLKPSNLPRFKMRVRGWVAKARGVAA